eukprot:scaffold28798_cov64-Phaeocystis_antarctica.AAC.2
MYVYTHSLGPRGVSCRVSTRARALRHTPSQTQTRLEVAGARALISTSCIQLLITSPGRRDRRWRRIVRACRPAPSSRRSEEGTLPPIYAARHIRQGGGRGSAHRASMPPDAFVKFEDEVVVWVE